MTNEEAFHAFLSRLVPHLQEHVGAHVQGDLEQAMGMPNGWKRIEEVRGPKPVEAKGPENLKVKQIGECSTGARKYIWRDNFGGPRSTKAK